MASSGPAPRRRRPRLQRWLSARGHSLEITRSGWLFIGLTLAVGATAMNSGSNLLHGVFGAQMALILGSGLLSEATVRRCTARRRVTGELFAGQPGAVTVEVHNRDPRVDVLSVSVEDHDESTRPGACAPVFAVRVAPGATVELPGSVTMTQRGRQRLPRAVVATRFPFGLFVKRRELPDDDAVVVYPAVKPVELDHGSSPHVDRGDAPFRRARVGEFFALREYRDGDDLRRLHWPALARTGRPFVREHQAEGDQEISLQLTSGVRGEPRFEAEVQTCASLALAWLGRGDVAVGLVVDGVTVLPAATGAGQRRAILEYLALCGRDPA